MKHYVGYHSRAKMGHAYLQEGEVVDVGGEHRFWTRKSYKPATLQGSRLWAFESDGKPLRYRLVGTGIIEDLPTRDRNGELTVVARSDARLAPRDVSDLLWFRALFKEQNQFSLGLSRIRGEIVIGALERLRTGGVETLVPEDPEPISTEDARMRILRAIHERQGGKAFRDSLLRAYDQRCAVSDCDAPDALEAAHVVPYLGQHTNRVDNGLLLRADLHTLFDRHLIAVDTEEWKVLVTPSLRRTTYGAFHGSPLRRPKRAELRPQKAGLDEHRRTAGF